ncbi:MAG TPA: Xaa-Pro peptidase family protein [Candidatus Nanoarchaeia archaeon]|nr:Xaa-Pro peptidase family protein [Candidatus Nanoarchaeia archaeon]
MKLKQFQSHLQKEGIDLVFLIHPDSNIIYFTQMKPSFAFLLITPDTASLYLSKLDMPPSVKNLSVISLRKDWEKKASDPKVKKIGINKSSISLAYVEKLQKMYPHAKLIDISLTLNELRAQKTPDEIQKITKACSITSQAFNSLINKFSSKKFKTERDVAFFLEKFIREHDAELAFPTIVGSGKNSAVPHHVTGSSKLQKGFLQLDFGASYKNYCSDMSRSLYIGKPTAAEKDHYNLLHTAQTEPIKAVTLNKPFTELDKISRKHLGKYSSYFIHSLGHGVGVEIHEAPSFSEEAKQTIKQNHIFTIEPGIYFPGKYGIRIEDTLLFDGKAKILTTSPKELVILK